MPVTPITLKQAQTELEDSIKRSTKRHAFWRDLEWMFRTGTSASGISRSTVAGTLWDQLGEETLKSANVILPRLSLMINQAANRDPRASALPSAGGDAAEQYAQLVEAIVDFMWQLTNSTEKLRDALQDAVVLGNGFLKVAWAHYKDTVQRSEKDIQDHFAKAAEIEHRAALVENRDPVPLDQLQKYIPTTEEVVLQDEPVVSYVRPYDIYVPAHARRIYETPWISQRMVLPIDEVRNNPAFKNTDSLTPTIYTSNDSGSILSHNKSVLESSTPDSLEYVEIYEFWHIESRTLLVFQRDAEVALFEDEFPYNHPHSPFVHLANYRDGGSEFFAFGDLENIVGIQLGLNKVYSKISDSLDRAGRRYLAWDDVLDEDAEIALASDEDDIVVKIKPNSAYKGLPLNQVIVPVDRQPLPADVMSAQTYMTEMLNDIAGINDFQAGGSGADRMSATAAASMQGVAEIRAQDKTAAVESAAGQLMNLLLLLCQQFLDPTDAVRIAGPGGSGWVNIAGPDIVGEFKMAVSPGTLKSVNPATKRQDAMQLIQLLPLLQQQGLNTQALAIHALVQWGLKPEDIKAIAPLPPPPPQQIPQNSAAPTAPGQPPSTPSQPAAADALQALGAPPVPANTQGTTQV